MKKHSVSLLFSLIAALLVAAAVLGLTACGSEKWAISWKIADNAVVTVDGYNELPSQLKTGTEISFTAEGKDGYEISSVMINGKSTSDRDGKYTLTLTRDTEIEVTVKASIASVKVTKTPDKTFYAGEEVDKEDLEVTVEYVPEEVEDKVVDTYSIVYAKGSAFSVGDTSFKVSFNGVESDDVTVPAVEVKITLNPVGGVINEEIIDGWRNNSSLHNFTVSEVEQGTGVITFTYSSLDEALVLPTNEQILLGDGASSSLSGWIDEGNTSYKQIALTQNVSLSLHAKWNVVLVEMEKIELVKEGDTPYLKMTLTANTDFSAYLYFSEGNNDYRLEGDSIEAKAGEKAVAKFDLTKLSSYVDEKGSTFAGAWMDIRINTRINGIDISQSFPLDPDEPVAEVGQMIHDDEWNYRLFTYESKGRHDLKICFRKYVYNYTAEVLNVDGKPVLTINGTLNKDIESDFAYEGADVSIDFGQYKATGKVNADGSWKATLDLSSLDSDIDVTAGNISITSADGTAFSINTSADNGTTSKTMLDLTGCSTIFDYYAQGSSPRWYANVTTIGDYRCTLGVDWNELWLNVVDVAHEITVTGVTITEKEGTVYLTMLGTYGYGYTADEFIEYFKEWPVTLQNNMDAGAMDWEMISIPEGGLIYEAKDGEYVLYISLADATSGQYVYAHVNNNDLKCPNIYGDVINIGDVEYTISAFTNWGGKLALVKVVDLAHEITLTGATLDVKDNKAYLVIEGTYAFGYTAEEVVILLKEKHIDLQNNDANGGGNWDMIPVPEGGLIYEAKDGIYRIYISLENGNAGYALYAHYGASDANFTTSNIYGEPVTADGKVYTLGIWNGWSSDLVTVYITEA